ncbi:MAG: hypothetical protein KF862_10860 [Chitinophagaceae bacterium]|nr:hypothetical protein [Chitinophagaceae bacterium]
MRVSRKKITGFIAATLWIGAAIALIIFLIAAMRKRDDKTCKGLDIEIMDVKNNLFADKNDIRGMLTHMMPEIKGTALAAFDLRQMEKTLEGNIWVKDAELFFDNNEILRVRVWEREPLARIFTQGGKSYYIDKDFVRLPLSTKFSARVPVFTGCQLDKTKWNSADSTLLQQVKAISAFIAADEFWMAQVAQVNYNEKKQFELIPTIGNHVIVLGDSGSLEARFKKLYVFYKEVLVKAGWNLYSTIDIRYKGQIVATRKDSTVKNIFYKQIQNTSDTTQ